MGNTQSTSSVLSIELQLVEADTGSSFKARDMDFQFALESLDLFRLEQNLHKQHDLVRES